MSNLPLPEFYAPSRLDHAWRVPYEERARQARAWSSEHRLAPASQDAIETWLLLIDVQNTFCLPEYELFVAGVSGTGAVDDNRRLCEFIYRNLGRITRITATMDTHQAMQIFHAIFLVDEAGGHPAPYTAISAAEVRAGKWRFNPALSAHYGLQPQEGQRRLEHYTAQLEESGKFALTVWPYHAMLGGLGHALVSGIEEALFFHAVARLAPTEYELKGDRAFTEHYSIVGPEVERGPGGEVLGARNPKFVERLQQVDRLVIAGQAKSHCVAWSIADLLADLQAVDPALAGKVYLLEDCTSPVVVPGADYSAPAEQAFNRFAAAGMHRVDSTQDFLAS